MRFVRAGAIAAVAACSLVVGSAGAADKSPFEGAWNLVMPRPGMTPNPAKARLALATRDGKWSGDVTFEQVLYGRTNKLADVVVKGDSIAFRLDSTEFDMRMDGKLAKGEISGRCAWKGCGDFDWTATRADDKPVERFEKGLTFDASLPKGDAETLDMDGAALDTLIRDASGNDTDAIVVLRDGKVVAERYFGRAQAPIHVMSITKWVTAFAVAMLVEEKKIASIDAPLSTWFPEWTDGLRAKVTLRHVLTHTSGIEHGANAAKLNAEKDKVAYVRAAAVKTEPGTAWEYDNEAVALLSGVLAKAAGRQVDEYLKEKLFAPLSIKNAPWDRDAAGDTITYAQLALSARDLARIGQLVVDGGKAGGKQLLAPESIASLETPATTVKDDQGLLWMLARDGPGKDVVGCYHTGWLGQWIVVFPKTRTVGVRLRRDKGGADAGKPEYEFGSFLQRLAAAAK
jgi:CubicO group peptidase (beta-lactamase class C family)